MEKWKNRRSCKEWWRRPMGPLGIFFAFYVYLILHCPSIPSLKYAYPSFQFTDEWFLLFYIVSICCLKCLRQNAQLREQLWGPNDMTPATEGGARSPIEETWQTWPSTFRVLTGWAFFRGGPPYLTPQSPADTRKVQLSGLKDTSHSCLNKFSVDTLIGKGGGKCSVWLYFVLLINQLKLP